jgi:GNAT superfamily N-acetyltransferase
MTAGSIERTLANSWSRLGHGSGLIRSASPADAELIRDFVCGLSPRSRYFRFFACACPPSTGLLRTLTGATGTADILLITDGGGAVIGHGMAADAPAADGRLETNIGLVITDDRQQRGLGTTLLAMLVSRAVSRGVHALVLNVLPENERMRGIIHRRWPDAALEYTRDGLVFRPLLWPTDATHPAELPAAIDLHPRGASPPCTPQTRQAGGIRVPGRSAA